MRLPTQHQLALLQFIFRQARIGKPCLTTSVTAPQLEELQGNALVQDKGGELFIPEQAIHALEQEGISFLADGEDARRPLIVITRYRKGFYGWELFHRHLLDSDTDYRGVAPCLEAAAKAMPEGEPRADVHVGMKYVGTYTVTELSNLAAVIADQIFG